MVSKTKKPFQLRPETADVRNFQSFCKMQKEVLLLGQKQFINSKPDQKYANFCTQKNTVYRYAFIF